MNNKMEQTLEVMEIERFAVHDGPGIRTTVFLQGCPLHCPWCANPESQTIKKKLLYQQQKCIGCGGCAKACPNDAIFMRDGRPNFDRERCQTCGTCVSVCPQNALRISGSTMTVDEILSTVLRDRDYYENSGGGMTVSGGEPFVQYNGFLELLQKAKHAGLHTAVETTGNVSEARFLEALPYIDLLLFDVKHTDAAQLENVTGADAALIMDNLRRAAALSPEKIVLRVPVIPTFNFDSAVIESIFNLAAELGIREVHLLPYHTLGKGKYEQLGGSYPFAVSEMLERSKLTPFCAMGEQRGIAVVIGG
ncbi:MAG: glycyl-radical enzyme activating protein [Christensenella sp.]|nr:glycyl-radical enzyme activating protein [Christensenella sp.]